MRKIAIWGVLALMAVALAAVPAFAVAPTSVTETGGLHVCQGSTLDVSATKTATGAFLTTTGDICGAGSTANVLLTSTAIVTTGCINPGSKDQQPQGLQRTTTTVAGSATVPTRAGRAQFSVPTSTVGLAGRTCPGKQTPVFV